MSSSDSEPRFDFAGAIADSVFGGAEEHCVPECPEQGELANDEETELLRTSVGTLFGMQALDESPEAAAIHDEADDEILSKTGVPMDTRAVYKARIADRINHAEVALEDIRGRRCALADTCAKRPLVMKQVLDGVEYQVTVCSSPLAVDVDGRARAHVVRTPATE